MQKLTQKLLHKSTWVIALICLFAGTYIAFNHTYQLLTPDNYMLGPMGDEAYDASRVFYPIMTGEKHIWRIFKPFADHRVVTERLLAMFDYAFTDGTGLTHPFRLSFVLWLTTFLFARFLFKIKALETSSKLLLTGICFALTFLNCSLTNYGTAILFTWPQVILYAFWAFLSVNKYAQQLEQKEFNTLRLWIMLTTTFVLLCLFSFNIGLILWPIIFIVLYKRNALNYHFKTWCTIAAISYLFYLSPLQATHKLHWEPGTFGNGLRFTLHHPLHVFDYFSRIISLPFITTAQTQASTIANMIGLFVIFMTSYYLIEFLYKRNWQSTDGILFSCLSFTALALTLITISRAWMVAEYTSIGLRFTTPGLLLWFSLITISFIKLSELQKIKYTPSLFLLSTVCCFWLVTLTIPGDNTLQGTLSITGDLNRDYFIALATDIPINDGFINSTKSYQNEYDLSHISYLNDIQKQGHKSAYSLWPSQYINKFFSELSLEIRGQPKGAGLTIATDLRKQGSPAIFVDASLPISHLLAEHEPWYLIITDQSNRIVGFGIKVNNVRNIIDAIINPTQQFTWKGVINSSLTQDHMVTLYVVNNDKHIAFTVGNLTI